MSIRHSYLGEQVEIDGEVFTVAYNLVGNWKTASGVEISTTGNEWFLVMNETKGKDVHISVLRTLLK